MVKKSTKKHQKIDPKLKPKNDQENNRKKNNFGPQKPSKIHPKSIEKSIKKSMQFYIGKSAKFYRTMGPRWDPKGVPKASKNVNLEVPWGVFFRPCHTSSSIAIKTRPPAPRDAHNTSWGTPNPIKFDGNCVVWDLVRRPL